MGPVRGLLVVGILVFFAEASRQVLQPLAELKVTPLSLDPANLPEYAARTVLRMLIALDLSLLFTLTYGTLAAKSKRAEVVLLPMLDILQSVPILGFISVTVVFFMALAPGRVLGAEFASIFAIFTEPSLEYGFQLLPIRAHGPDGARRSLAHTQIICVDALLAPRSAVRNASAHLEYDDVHVGELVFRCCVRVH